MCGGGGGGALDAINQALARCNKTESLKQLSANCFWLGRRLVLKWLRDKRSHLDPSHRASRLRGERMRLHSVGKRGNVCGFCGTSFRDGQRRRICGIEVGMSCWEERWRWRQMPSVSLVNSGGRWHCPPGEWGSFPTSEGVCDCAGFFDRYEAGVFAK